MHIKDDKTTVSKYEVVSAFFLTEQEENAIVAHELNRMINAFCEAERRLKQNVTSLSFDTRPNRQTIEYIKRASV